MGALDCNMALHAVGLPTNVHSDSHASWVTNYQGLDVERGSSFRSTIHSDTMLAGRRLCVSSVSDGMHFRGLSGKSSVIAYLESRQIGPLHVL